MNDNKPIAELREENDVLRTKMNMYERKVRRLRRTLGEYMNKYEWRDGGHI